MWLPPNFDGILPELRAVPNWVLADNAKVPRHPDGWKASPTDAATWSSFAQVRSAYDANKHAGIGYVLDGKPHFSGKYLHGFDWDHCIEDGEIDPNVMAAVNKLLSKSSKPVASAAAPHKPTPGAAHDERQIGFHAVAAVSGVRGNRGVVWHRLNDGRTIQNSVNIDRASGTAICFSGN